MNFMLNMWSLFDVPFWCSSFFFSLQFLWKSSPAGILREEWQEKTLYYTKLYAFFFSSPSFSSIIIFFFFIIIFFICCSRFFVFFFIHKEYTRKKCWTWTWNSMLNATLFFGCVHESATKPFQNFWEAWGFLTNWNWMLWADFFQKGAGKQSASKQLQVMSENAFKTTLIETVDVFGTVRICVLKTTYS